MGMQKLSQNDQEALMELMENTEGVRALLVRIEHVVRSIEDQVLSLPLTPQSETEVLHRKARAEGARKVLVELKTSLKLT